MSIFHCSEIKIKTNYTTIGRKPYNTLKLGGDKFLKRKGRLNGNLHDVVVRIDDNGRVLDSDSNELALPCPTYCEIDKAGEKGKIKRIGSLPGTPFPPNDNPPPLSNYNPADRQTILNQADCSAILELEVLVLSTQESKRAIIGINSKGRIMDSDTNKVAVEI